MHKRQPAGEGLFYPSMFRQSKLEIKREKVYIAMGLAQYNRLSDSQKAVVDQAGAECQAYEHELFLDNEEKYYNQLQEQGMEFIEVDTDAFAKAMIDGVLPILTDSQKKIYDAIAALA